MGLVLFPDDPTMRLGMFFTGVAPGGGASNIWTAILEGNIDLSILMTTVSTLSAFGMMPLWLFTLGATIFDDANIEVSPRIHYYILTTNHNDISGALFTYFHLRCGSNYTTRNWLFNSTLF